MGLGWFISNKQKIPLYERQVAGWEQSHHKSRREVAKLASELHFMTELRDNALREKEIYNKARDEYENVVLRTLSPEQREKFEAALQQYYEQTRASEAVSPLFPKATSQ
jgi:hypothetical protein